MELDAALQSLPAELRDAVAREWGHYVSSAREQGIDVAVLAPVIASVPCVWAGSAFIVQHCARAPGLLADLVGSGDLERVYAASFYGECLTRSLGAIDNEAALARELRLIRSREMLRIAWRDLAGWAALQETLRDLSYLASACLVGALRCLDSWQAAEWGVATGARSGARQGLVVVGMGKLGAGELNFSSDIDLIFAYPEDGETVGGARTLSNEDYFRRLAQRLIQAINAPMAEGFVFRVDMRLRPFGDSGSLVMSFDAMEEYYQSHCRRLDPGVPLPLAAVALVILFHRIEAHHQRTAVAERTQPHVDAIDEALGHRRVDRLNETLGEAAEIIFIRECPRATHGLTVLWIGEDQVDVGGKIEFARPELAHADDDQTLPRAAARARRHAPLGRLPRIQTAQGAVEAGGGQVGKIPQGLL